MTGHDAVVDTVDHLFRHEAGKMVAVLTRVLGVQNVDLAEEIVQDVLCRALETWKFGRMPENPAAWLMLSARNRAFDWLRAKGRRDRLDPKLREMLTSGWGEARFAALFVQHEIRDDQLRMMFSCCAPNIPPEAQIALVLKTLCGFSVGEIAVALLTSEAGIQKRISRAKQQLRRGGLFEVTGSARLRQRLASVHNAIYLLFNEGYHGSHEEASIREELCAEALRLASLLAEHPATAAPSSHALLAVLCLHAGRLPGRLDSDGDLLSLEYQDRSTWNRALIARGLAALSDAAEGDAPSPYHLEAAIAAVHCTAESFADTNWSAILDLYDKLLGLDSSPVVRLNRAIALGQLRGPEAGLRALAELHGIDALADYPFLPLAEADLLQHMGDVAGARERLIRAAQLARSASERRFVDTKLAVLGGR